MRELDLMNIDEKYFESKQKMTTTMATVGSVLLIKKNYPVIAMGITHPEGFSYKGMIFTDFGVLKYDTSHYSVINKSQANSFHRSWKDSKYKPVYIGLNDLIKNWKKYGIWESRKLELKIVEEYENYLSEAPVAYTETAPRCIDFYLQAPQ